MCAIAVNSEGLPPREVRPVCHAMAQSTGLPTVDVLADGPTRLAEVIAAQLEKHKD